MKIIKITKYRFVERSLILLSVLVFLNLQSCSTSQKICSESGYIIGWNYNKRINVNGKDEGHSSLYYVENCLVNGKHIIFYPNGTILSSGNMVSGKFVGQEFQYDSLGNLNRIIYHEQDSTFFVEDRLKVKGKKSLH